jgi:8-amino-3,8-dideoxy-alpha-D-manno-octulosonate transaminase
VATYSAIIFAGLVPVLTEIDESLNMDPEKIESRITPRSKVIMPVHMLGNPCDMAAIQTVAKRHGLFVVEDCCQSVGGSFRGKKVGTLGEIGAYSLNINKTITTGDGGVVVTNEKKLYQRCFAIHDQGHSPFRGEVEIGKRSILGLNFRMTELSGAVALAQLRKIKTIIAELKKKKNKFKDLIADVKELKFRKLNDPAGECGTLCTVIFEQKEKAEKVAKILGTKTVDRSGWHVYANMEHINNYLKEIGKPFGKGAYPITDDILSRAINISIGVVDDGLGSGFGININSTEKEIADAAEKFCQACRQAS